MSLINTPIGKCISSENYFQAYKFVGTNEEYVKIIMNADSPMKAKMLGTQKKNIRFGKNWVINKQNDRRIVNNVIDEFLEKTNVRKDWENIKIRVMIDAIIYKFSQNKKLMNNLLKENDNVIFTEHTKDCFWGDGINGIGKNILGKILTSFILISKGRECKYNYLKIDADNIKVYTGMIHSLQNDEIFVFGSNPEGRHGMGTAKIALNKFGAISGKGGGIQGKSYGLITMNLTAGIVVDGEKYSLSGRKSVTKKQITKNILELYEFAIINSSYNFMIAYHKGGKNSNGYSDTEMAHMFYEAGTQLPTRTIPKNIIFEKGFYELIKK